MLEEPHYPSKWSVAIVFAVILILIIGVFAWAFYFNRGSLIIQGDRNFSLEVNGKEYACTTSCTVSLPPNIYEITARAEGYYEQRFSMQVSRWQATERHLSFELIPFLKPVSVQEIPEPSLPDVRLEPAEGSKVWLTFQGKTITTFESLQEPRVQAGGSLAVVLDKGRIFFVDLVSGRKIRRFDDTVLVRDALMSDNGNKVLLFVTTQQTDLLWLWIQETSEMITLGWYSPSSFIQWQSGKDHRFFVISDQLQGSQKGSLLEEVVESAKLTKFLTLFQYNLDTGKAEEIKVFDEKKPVKLHRRGERYFVEYEGGEYQELVVK